MRNQLMLFIFLFLVVVLEGQSEESIYRQTITILNLPRIVRVGETYSLKLSKNYFVHKIMIQAQSVNSDDTYAEVSVNGDIKGTIYAPGTDPHYVVTIAENTESIEFTTIDNKLKLISIQAIVSNEDNIPPFPDQFSSQMASLSAASLKYINRLEDYSSYEDFGAHLLPLRKAAAKSLAYAEARGDLSSIGRPYYQVLLDTLDASQSYFNKMIEISSAYEIVINLMTTREKIRKLLR